LPTLIGTLVKLKIRASSPQEMLLEVNAKGEEIGQAFISLVTVAGSSDQKLTLLRSKKFIGWIRT